MMQYRGEVGYWILEYCGIGGHGGFGIGWGDGHGGHGIGGGCGIGWGYEIMGWAGFSICCLLVNASARGREGVGVGGTASGMG